ncbi:peptidoglycan DD-metalloendopeptidase family protein [Deinococcus planocerae]|uniref:peptidoglycan DD-metalloendopeptidase family protein n=1 Tax=Deinococcus planocerae TaxID=1737569 RepID=UPI0011AEE3C6|nr:peptidoglycan DD-metalloendopeptidase family protein [Deinococcus planocerae]
MRRAFILPAVFCLTAALAACGSAPTAHPTVSPDATARTPAQGTVTPYYIFAETSQARLVSGSAVVEQGGARVPDGRLYLQDRATGSLRLLTTPARFGEGFYADGGALSPDGRTAYTVVNAGGDWALYAIDTGSGAAAPVLSRQTALEHGLTEAEGKTLVVSPDGRQLAFRGYTIRYDEQAGTTTHTNALYLVDLPGGVGAQGAGTSLVRVAIRGTGGLPAPGFDAQGRLVETPERPTRLSEAARGQLQAQDLGVVGRLPVAGTVALSQSFHGSGYAGGSSWGLGLDLAPRPLGTTMAARSIASGVVKNVYSSGCGVYVVVDHTTTTADTYYCHLVTGSPAGYGMAAGKALYEGQPLGTVGNTGVSTGVHLHLALIQGDVFGLRGRDPTRTGCTIAGGNWTVGREYQYLADPC